MDLRFTPQVPKGFKVFVKNIEITGLHVPENKELGMKFANGKNQYVTLKREPDNKYDKNAVAVIAHWKGLFINYSGHIGYIPRDVAEEMAKHPPISNFEAELNTIDASPKGYYVNIRVNLFCRENI